MKDFKIETFDGGCLMYFFTKAKDHKRALGRMLSRSTDFKNICRTDSNLNIKVIELK